MFIIYKQTISYQIVKFNGKDPVLFRKGLQYRLSSPTLRRLQAH